MRECKEDVTSFLVITILDHFLTQEFSNCSLHRIDKHHTETCDVRNWYGSEKMVAPDLMVQSVHSSASGVNFQVVHYKL